MNETDRNTILDALALAAETWDDQSDKELAQTLHDRITTEDDALAADFDLERAAQAVVYAFDTGEPIDDDALETVDALAVVLRRLNRARADRTDPFETSD